MHTYKSIKGLIWFKVNILVSLDSIITHILDINILICEINSISISNNICSSKCTSLPEEVSRQVIQLFETVGFLNGHIYVKDPVINRIWYIVKDTSNG